MSRVLVDIDAYLKDCPPWDGDCEGLTDQVLREVAEDVFSRFDFTEIYGQIDELCCSILRERGLKPSGE